MRFSSIFINLLEIFRIISFVFDLKYLSQNSINFNMLGVFWNPQDEQNPKLSLDLCFEQHLKEILRVLHWCRCWLPPLYVCRNETYSLTVRIKLYLYIQIAPNQMTKPGPYRTLQTGPAQSSGLAQSVSQHQKHVIVASTKLFGLVF